MRAAALSTRHSIDAAQWPLAVVWARRAGSRARFRARSVADRSCRPLVCVAAVVTKRTSSASLASLCSATMTAVGHMATNEQHRGRAGLPKVPTYLGREPRHVRSLKPDQQAGQGGGLVAVGGDLLVQHF
jgi:hypothetical protein